jgi:alkanesulfonate monooxygenase SsuD/methylene tetrahydromethanopterin reductase-like flavin-dependent oxidoreductase (luciferase family)
VHVGVKLGLTNGAEMAEHARRAESLGYHSVWLSERVAVPVDQPHPYEPSIDPWIGLAFIAASTSRVVLSTTVSQIALRDPVLMARELATLDILSEGRMMVGAGAGWVTAEFDATNVPFATRGGRLGEFVRLLRKLWTAPEEGWEGKHFRVPGVKLVRPYTPGGPRVFMGAATRPGLRRAAKLADGLLMGSLPLAGVIEARNTVLERRRELGLDRPFPVYAQVEPPETIEAAREVARGYREAEIDGIILSERFAREPGFPKDDGVSRALIEAAAD